MPSCCACSKDVPLDKRTARFRCVLALTPVLRSERQRTSPVCYADEAELQTELFEGTCEGRIGFAPRGQGGFGYDPLFMPVGFEQTFGELGEETKNQLSHRAQALAKLKQRLDSAAGRRTGSDRIPQSGTRRRRRSKPLVATIR